LFAFLAPATILIFPSPACAEDCAFDYQYVGSHANWGGGAKSGTISGPCSAVRQSYQKYLRANAAMHVYRLSSLRVISQGGGVSRQPDEDDLAAARERERAEWERQQQEAARRAAEEYQRRQQEEQNRYAAAHSGAVDLMRNRLSGGNPSGVDLPPVSLAPTAPATPTVRTVAVPLPRVDPSMCNRSAVIDKTASPLANFTLSPTAAAMLGVLGENIRDVPTKLGEKVIAVLGLENHYNVLKLAKGLSDEVEQSVNKAVDLIGRGYPEPETSEFVKGSEGRVLKVYVKSMSDIPLPEDEGEMEQKGRKWFAWLTGKSKDKP
jgi:hypothetical protein